MIAPSTADSQETIRVCCVFLCHDQAGRLLLHRRTQACRDEAGAWDSGGGALEFGEDPAEAVRREVHEEYGVFPNRVRVVGTRNVLREQNGNLTHWVALVFDVLVDPNAVRLGEPDKMAELGWFDMEALPTPLHSQLRDHLALLPRRRRRPVIVSSTWWSAAIRRFARPTHPKGSQQAGGRLLTNEGQPDGQLCEAR